MQRHTPSRVLVGFFARAQWDRAMRKDMEEDDGGKEDEGEEGRRRKRMGKEQEQESEDEEQEIARVEE